MLWAIDVGNTQTVVGLWDGTMWVATWRRATDAEASEDELAAWINALSGLANLPFEADAVVVASVVPQASQSLARFARRWLGCEACFLIDGNQVGLVVLYDPPRAVGADRIANALGALAKWKPPIIVVDFGTATTFDAIDRQGAYAGGAILPGVEVSSRALVGRTAKLPQIELKRPERAVGRSTVESLQSGIVLGHAGAVDALVSRMDDELGGGSMVVATGGLGGLFEGLCESISGYDPLLTLDGLRLAWDLMRRA